VELDVESYFFTTFTEPEKEFVEAMRRGRQKVFGESVEGMGQGRRMRKGPLELLEGRGGQECPYTRGIMFSVLPSWRDGATRETSFAGSIPQTLGGAVRSNEGLRQFRRRGHPGAGWQGCEIIARRSMRRIAIPTVRRALRMEGCHSRQSLGMFSRWGY